MASHTDRGVLYKSSRLTSLYLPNACRGVITEVLGLSFEDSNDFTHKYVRKKIWIKVSGSHQSREQAVTEGCS